MKTRPLILTFLACAAAAHADPILTSWFTENSGALARVIQTTSTIPTTGTRNTTPVTTWPTAGITNNNTGGLAQTATVYADVQRIRYDASWVYINSSGLASYTMGPFLTNGTGLFGFWPVSQNFTIKLPRTPGAVPAAKTSHAGGPIGVMVNGVVIYDLGDAFGFVQTASSPVTGSDSMGQTNTTHPWWRDALAVEVVTFDPGFAHQPGINGQYHYHAEPKALRYQLGDNMQATYDATNHTYSYTEDASNLQHSPILGWSYDGYPIYGPYGYSSPMDAGSSVSRMRSGFVLRNGANATTNLASTGRTTLPKWAAIAEGFATLANYSGQTLSNGDYVLSAATLYGPATSYVNGATTYSLGRYIGDYDFLGDRGQTQGASGTFDLDQYNGRTCVTPEFPGGTYAYFVTNDATGKPAFPYMLGKQYNGTKSGTAQGVTVPGTGVTELFNGGASLTETWSGSPAVNSSNGNVTLTWNSVESGTYKVEASDDLSTWNTLAASVPAPANTILPAPADVITTTSITETGAALPANHTKRFYRVSRTALAPAVASLVSASGVALPSAENVPPSTSVQPAVESAIPMVAAAPQTALAAHAPASNSIAAPSLPSAQSLPLPTVIETPAATVATTSTDPRLSLWMTSNSTEYARVTETTSFSSVAVWPSPGIPQNNANNEQLLPAYADVQQVLYSTNFVYVRSSDLASHRMGPWYKEYAKINVNGLWPENRRLTSKIPRNPTPATTQIQVQKGPVGVLVNGVTIANLGDGSGWNPTTQRDAGITGGGVPGNQTNVWIRCATGAEGPILDAGFGHPAPDGGYHYHANPRALRYQLGDNLTYNAATDTYTENIANLHHSPVVGWAYDGYPIYGPYGCSSAMDASSPVRRMVSGHVPRDGSFGTVNLATAGRHSLAPWAALFHTFTATLGSSDYPLAAGSYGPDVSASFPIGWYAEDFDYLGDRGYTQGIHFDLDKPNGRICVTPEFPGGTYAYFIPIDTNGAPAFPFSIGRYWYGNNAGGRVVNGNIAETVTTLFTGGPAVGETWRGGPAVNAAMGDVTLTWNSLEGGSYQIEASNNLTSWSTIAPGVPAASNASQTSFTETAAALPTNNTKRFYKATRAATAIYDPAYTGQ